MSYELCILIFLGSVVIGTIFLQRNLSIYSKVNISVFTGLHIYSK